jgi:hypothetical protein
MSPSTNTTGRSTRRDLGYVLYLSGAQYVPPIDNRRTYASQLLPGGEGVCRLCDCLIRGRCFQYHQLYSDACSRHSVHAR